jgi:hypothetical protein
MAEDPPQPLSAQPLGADGRPSLPADQLHPGMSFPLDRYYHRGHAWAHPEADGTMTVAWTSWEAACQASPTRWTSPRPVRAFK